MSQYPPQDPNYPPYQGGQSGPYGAPDPYGQPQYPQQGGGYGAPQQPAYPAYPQTPQPQYPQAPQPQYPQTPAQPQYPGYGAPGTPSQYGMQAPQSQYGYPQAPGLPPAPAPSSNRGTITGIAIAAVVVVLVVVGVFVLRNLSTASYAGTWYGKAHLNATVDSSGTSVSADVEVFMDLQQDSGGKITGTGKLCVNVGGSATPLESFPVSGSVSGSNATLAWTSGTALSVNASLSGGTMSLNASDSSGTFSGSVQKGSETDYNTGCAQLTPVSTGG